MKYKIKAHPTTYAGVNFRSRLEARWAAFFNCMKWPWKYEPLDLESWTPDFRIECNGYIHLAEVKPYFRIDQFRLHPCWELGLCLGVDPTVTGWKRDGKLITLADCNNPQEMEIAWIAAGNLTQWKKKKKQKQKWNNMLEKGL